MNAIDLIVSPEATDPDAIDVWIDCSIGRDVIRFRLDTGAARCRLVDSETARVLPSTGLDGGFGASGVGLDENEDEVTIPLMRIGDVEVADVAATRTGPRIDVSPLLGMSALTSLRCEFRFGVEQLVVSGDVVDGENGLWFELAMHPAGQPIVPVRFGAVEVRACWDTGASLTAVDAGFARSHPGLVEPIRESVGFDASGVEMATSLARMEAFEVEGVAFLGSACAVVDLGPLNAALRQHAEERGDDFEPMSVILGMPAIGQADWAFDFPQRRWTFLTAPSRC